MRIFFRNEKIASLEEYCSLSHNKQKIACFWDEEPLGPETSIVLPLCGMPKVESMGSLAQAKANTRSNLKGSEAKISLAHSAQPSRRNNRPDSAESAMDPSQPYGCNDGLGPVQIATQPSHSSQLPPLSIEEETTQAQHEFGPNQNAAIGTTSALVEWSSQHAMNEGQPGPARDHHDMMTIYVIAPGLMTL